MNKRLLSNTISFAVGVIIGSAVTYNAVKKKFRDIAAEEITAVREYYKRKTSNEVRSLPEKEELVEEANKILKENGYIHDDSDEEPYEIDFECYANRPDYEEKTLYYYSDGMLADEQEDLVEDLEHTIGYGNLDVFCDDSSIERIYVRNDRMKTDFEIIRLAEKYNFRMGGADVD